jgi:hypothetical protein
MRLIIPTLTSLVALTALDDQRIPRWLPFSTPGLRSCSGTFSPHHESMGDQLHNRRHKVLGCGLISTIHENVDAGGELEELRDRSNHGDQRIAFRFSKNTI